MDTFTRRYLLVLGAIALLAGGYWLVNLDGRVGDLNRALAEDELVASYPYAFRVLSIESAVARLNSPRSAEMSVIQGLRILYPELKSASPVSDEMVAAQKAMAAVQSRAMEIVLAHEDVKKVVWVLDEVWLGRHGVYVQ